MDDRGPSSDQQAFKIRATVPDWERHPDLKQIASALLRAGPRSKTEMVCWAIRDRNTGEFHSHKVTLRTYEKDKNGQSKKDLKKISYIE